MSSTEDRGFIYTLGETEVFVSSRPKRLFSKEDGAEFNPDAYLSVTDTFCSPVENKIFTWMPWNEQRYPTPELFYAVNRSLNWWIEKQKLKKVQIFCDAGTHRSVTVFGAYLMTYYTQDERLQIVGDRVAIPDDAESCNPLYYIEGYLNTFPEDMVFFKEMGEDRLARLDGLCNNVFKTVQDRYGNRFKS